MKDFKELIRQHGLISKYMGVYLVEESVMDVLSTVGELSGADIGHFTSAVCELNDELNMKGETPHKIAKLISSANMKFKKEKNSREEVYSDPIRGAMMYKGRKVADFAYEPLFATKINGEHRYYYNALITSNIQGKVGVIKKSTIYFTKEILANSKQIKNTHLKTFGIDAVFMDEVPAVALIDGMIANTKFPEKKVTGHLGVINDKEDEEQYYVATPGEIYDVKTGKPTDKMIYAPSAPNADNASIFKNMKYDPVEFPDVAKVFGENAYKLNNKKNMAMIIGHMHAAIHEYVFRKERGNTSFPILFVQGLRGSGKTSVMMTLAPYMGYAENEKVLDFSQQSVSAMQNKFFSSHNIPRIVDEYGKVNTAGSTGFANMASMDIFIGSVANKGKRERGTTSFTNIGEEYKNPAVILGQFSPKESSLVSRGVFTSFEKSYIMDTEDNSTEKGAEAKKAMNKLMGEKDKNYITGMMILQRQMFNNKHVRWVYDYYLDFVTKNYKQENRNKEALAVIMTGLFCYIKAQEKLGNRDIGFTRENVLEIPVYAKEMKESADIQDESHLDQFINSIPSYALANANSSVNNSSDMIGLSKALFVEKATRTTYRNGKKGYEK